MPMLQSPIDAEAGAAATGGRVADGRGDARLSASRIPRAARAAERSPRGTSCASWRRPIAPQRPVVLAPSCAVRAFTPPTSPTGASSRDAGAFGALAPAKRGRRRRLNRDPLAAKNWLWLSTTMPV